MCSILMKFYSPSTFPTLILQDSWNNSKFKFWLNDYTYQVSTKRYHVFSLLYDDAGLKMRKIGIFILIIGNFLSHYDVLIFMVIKK